MNHPGISRSSSAKGRIAQVLAHARASLQEPSRPVTPAALDQRTSLNFTPSSYATMEESSSSAKSRLIGSSSSLKPNILVSNSVDIPTTHKRSSTTTIFDENDDEANAQPPYVSANSSEGELIGFLQSSLRAFRLAKVISLDMVVEFLQELKQRIDIVIKALRTQIQPITNFQQLSAAHSVATELAALLLQTLASSPLTLAQPLQVYFALLLKLALAYAPATPLQPSPALAAASGGYGEVYGMLETYTKEIHSLLQPASQANPAMLSTESVHTPHPNTTSSSSSNPGDMLYVLCVPSDVLVEALGYTYKHMYGMSQTRTVWYVLVGYVCACVRYFTADSVAERKRLGHNQGLIVIGQYLQWYVNFYASAPAVDSQTHSDIHAPLIQILGVLRNLSLDKAGRGLLMEGEGSVLDALCQLTLLIHPQATSSSAASGSVLPAEVVLNLTRVLAKLSLYETFRTAVLGRPQGEQLLLALTSVLQSQAAACEQLMSGDNNAQSLQQLAASEWPHWFTWPLLSRVSFTLANFTNSNPRNRMSVGMRGDASRHILLLLRVSADSLVILVRRRRKTAERREKREKRRMEEESVGLGSVFKFAQAVLPASKPTSTSTSTSDDEEEDEDPPSPLAEQELKDAVIKLVRLLANLCICAEVGEQVGGGSMGAGMGVLLELGVVCEEGGEEYEELLLNVVAAMTNVTYYACQRLSSLESVRADARLISKLERALLLLCAQLSPHLFHDNHEVVLEVCRVYGNLSRREAVVTWLCSQGVLPVFILLLQHANPDIVQASLGVLVNVTAHGSGRQALVQRNVGFVQQLNAHMKRLSLRAPEGAMLVCQVLFNMVSSSEYQQVEEDKEYESILLGEVGDTLEVWLDTLSLDFDEKNGEEEGLASVVRKLLTCVQGLLK